MNTKPIIIALDSPDLNKLYALIDKLSPEKCRLKVGKALFTRFGPELVTQLQARQFEIFLDLKFHDIPNTVSEACKAAADLGVWMCNVHALGGARMLKAAAEALLPYGKDAPILIAVTLLTSLSGTEWRDLGSSHSLESTVLDLARLAKSEGLSGVVCSPHETGSLRNALGASFVLVTPGIRLEQSTVQSDDQTRISTPLHALQQGSNYLVIGRPITEAADPMKVLEAITTSIEIAVMS